MPDKLTDKEIVTTLNEADGMEHIAIYCADGKGNEMKTIPMVDIVDLINRLQADCENYKQVAENQQKVTLDRGFEIKRLKEKIDSLQKEVLKSKVFKYVRNPNRIYTIMDFQDGEILRFYDYPEQPNALASGHYKFQGKNDIRLIHISEVKELSYDETKAEAYKEFAYELKQIPNVAVYKYEIDNLLKELVGEGDVTKN